MASIIGGRTDCTAVAGASIELSSELPAGWFVTTVVLTSSMLTSRSQVRLKSSDARRNSAMLLPSERLSCGSLRGPKKIRAMAKINSSSVLPSDSRISKTTFRKFLSVASKRRTVRNDCNLQPYKAEICGFSGRMNRVQLCSGKARLTLSRTLAQPWLQANTEINIDI